MARYDISPAWFRTPGGRSALVYIREGTNDWNTAQASMTEDEYHLHELTLDGHGVDIGGYLGTVTLGLLIDNPKLRMTIVEPVPNNLDLIVKNLMANGVFDRAEVVRGAIGYPSGGTSTIHYGFSGNEQVEHHAYIGNMSLLSGIGPLQCPDHVPHVHVEVPTVTIGELVGPDTQFLKIDCEGGEWLAFEDEAIRTVPRIHGELHPVNGHRMSDIEALLPDHDISLEFPPDISHEYGPAEFRAVLR